MNDKKETNLTPLSFFIRRAVFGLAVCWLSCSSGFAQEPPGISFGAYTISREYFHRDGVWVSRPNSEDLKFCAFLSSQAVKTLDDYEKWLDGHMEYKDPGKEWSSPADVVRRGWGDCKDYAVLNEAALKVLGYEPKLLAIETDDLGHAVCYFELNGFYAYFDNGRLYKTETSDLTAFAAKLYGRYPFRKLLSLDPVTKKTQLLLIVT